MRTSIALLWLAWAAYWGVTALHVKPADRRESLASQALHLGPLALAAILLWGDDLDGHGPGLSGLSEPTRLALALAFTAAGLALAVWARRHIGRNWSATVTLKAGHELVVTGPYALVRHPIYTGLLMAFAGAAIARDDLRGIAALVIAGAALWRKLRLEERWMRERFGLAYDAYAQRVRALIPFVI